MKRKWFIVIFTVLIIVAFIFVWWMSSSNFEGSYREITQQYYGVVAGQVVSELESSIKYGKSLDSFYNVNSLFEKLTSLLPSHVKAAITNSRGEILYTSFDGEKDKQSYIDTLRNPHVTKKVQSITKDRNYTSMVEGKYEIMILPIADKSNTVIGSFVLLYPAAVVNEELQAENMHNLKITLLILIVPVLLLIVFLSLVPVMDNEKMEEGSVTEDAGRRRKKDMRLLIHLVPALVVILGIGLQSSIMYNQYKITYKNALSDGAKGILTYIENSVSTLHQKGVPYEKMYGLSEYLSTKAKNTPIVWNIRIYNTIADTSEELKRESSWGISAPLSPDSKGEKMQMEIQISEEYMNGKMLNMLLVFLVTMIVSGVVIFEAMRLPDILIFRQSNRFNTSCEAQYEKITSELRIISFLIFTGMYASMPFSAILMRQMDARPFGLSADVAASLPITLELLAIMLFSMLFARVFRTKGLNVIVYTAGLCIIVGNVFSAYSREPYQILLSRIACGIGFAGIKHVLNTIISSGSDGSERTGMNIAGMNAGLLGGVMCGGSLGAVIANSMGISFTYMFTAGILIAFPVLTAYVIPWKLIKNHMVETVSGKNDTSGILKVLSRWNVLKYILMVTIPLNVGLMFIVAFIPGYIEKMNLPVILISYGYLINGLLGIYLGPALVKLMTKRIGRNMSVSLMLLMGGAAVVITAIKPSVGIILLSSALMGLFDGFGSPVSMDYFIEMPEIKGKVEVSSSLALLGVLGNAIQMLSPMMYGWLMLLSSGSGFNTLLVLGLIYLVFAMGFIIPFKKGSASNRIAA